MDNLSKRRRKQKRREIFRRVLIAFASAVFQLIFGLLAIGTLICLGIFLFADPIRIVVLIIAILLTALTRSAYKELVRKDSTIKPYSYEDKKNSKDW